LEQRLKIKF